MVIFVLEYSMDKATRITQESINEFGSEATRGKYEEIAKRGLWGSEKILIDKYFKPNSNILDLGCGSGRTTVPLYRQQYKVIGVDLTPQMIEIASLYAKSNNMKIDYRMGNATQLEFDDNCFHGTIFANNGWAQIPGNNNRTKALKEIYRTLKPGGILILTAHERYYSLHYIGLWMFKWFKFYVLRNLGIEIEEVDYGDMFFRRHLGKKKLKQRQFIHIAGRGEVENLIKISGFKLLLRRPMGQLSRSDANEMQGSLSSSDNSYKSPVFYICEK